MQIQMGNLTREIKITGKTKMEMLEIITRVRDMRGALDVLIYTLNC